MNCLTRWVLAALLVAATPGVAQEGKPTENAAGVPKYRLVKPEKFETFGRMLNAAADQGYRVLVLGPFCILRLDVAPPDTYRYSTYEFAGGPVKYMNWLNEQGSHGYRLLAGSGLLEKEPHPHNYEYTTSGHTMMGDPVGQPTLSYLVGQGYRPVHASFFGSLLGHLPTEFLLEREIGAKPKSASTVADQIKIADAMKAGNIMKHVDQFAKEGYRYLAPYVSRKGGGIAVLLEKCDASCGGTFEYRYFDVKSAAQAEQELNTNGKDGFRVVSSALRERPHMLEHRVGDKTVFTYRVLETKDKEIASFEKELNAADVDGYTPLGYAWRVGWTAEGYLILEKAVSPSVSPQERTAAAAPGR